MEIIRLENVTKIYHIGEVETRALNGVSLSISEGEFTAIVGPSGAGKTSLLACLAGTLKPSEGEVVFRCAEGCPHAPSAFRKRLGIVFQNFLLVGNGTLLHNVLCGRLGRYPWWRTLAGFPRADRHEERSEATVEGRCSAPGGTPADLGFEP